MAKTLEVDEAEWLGSQRLRDTLVKVANHPKAKLLLQEAHKLVDPAAITPDLDRKTEENERVSAVQKKLDDFLEAQAKEKAEATAKASLDALMAKVEGGLLRIKRDHRLTDEGVEHVRKIMQDEGILDAEIAFAVFEKRNPPQMPSTPRGGTGAWNFLEDIKDDDKYPKALIETKGQNDLVLDREIHAALNEIRGR